MTSFATPDDVAVRWRPLTDAEVIVAQALCLDASTLLRARFPGLDSQVSSGQVDVNAVVAVTAGMVKRALVAPDDGVASESETVGPFSRSQTYANPMRNVFLTAADITLILGYQPAGQSNGFSNTTRHRENLGPGYFYVTPA